MKVLNFQRHLNELRNNDKIGDSFIILEHDDVYTSGVHYKGNTKGIIKTERGGYLTYHGPGQLVTYFIVNLKERKMNAMDIIIKIQNTIMELLEKYGIEAHAEFNEKTGVWVGNKKICSIGLAIKGFSTLHGMALNVNTDLNKFLKINPCNFNPDIMTSMENILGNRLNYGKIKGEYLKILLKDFNIEKYSIIKSIENNY